MARRIHVKVEAEDQEQQRDSENGERHIDDRGESASAEANLQGLVVVVASSGRHSQISPHTDPDARIARDGRAAGPNQETDTCDEGHACRAKVSVELTPRNGVSHRVNEEETHSACKREFENGAVLRDKEAFAALADRFCDDLHGARSTTVVQNLAQ